MNKNLISKLRSSTLGFAFRWTLITLPVSITIGLVIALFLWLLDSATRFRFAHQWLLFALPLAGLLIYFIYSRFGASSEKGNNLILEEIERKSTGVPLTMAPLILITTVITHLFGGSAGREGTAVQIGGSIAAWYGRCFRLNTEELGILLTAGIAAGFAGVFGTPLSGTVFALEVLVIGKIKYNALIPCLIAAVISDLTVAALGIHHTAYRIEIIPTHPYFLSAFLPLDLILLFKVILSSICFGLVSFGFSSMIQFIKSSFAKFSIRPWLIPLIGGLVIILITVIMEKPDYLGLGVSAQYQGAVTIPSAFKPGGSDTWSWLWKTTYTSITLATGFKGGEVTPLFYIGATLGNTLAGWLDAPVSLFAAIGFIAVFSGATNTPLACTIMGVELFGSQYALLFAVGCFTAYLFSGSKGIYGAQKFGVPKAFRSTTRSEAELL